MAKINFYNEDCLEAMKKMKDNQYDLAIVDPPYGIGKSGQHGTKKVQGRKKKKSDRKHHEDKGWDNSIPSKEYFDELFRISKNQIIWGANYFVEHLKIGSMGWIVWDKGQHGLSMSDCELCFSSFQRATRIFVQNRCILRQEGDTIHPTQKPIKLYEWILMNYAETGFSIIDTHGGSHTHAIACHNLGFDLDIFEIDKDYHEKGKKQFEQHISQIRMF